MNTPKPDETAPGSANAAQASGEERRGNSPSPVVGVGASAGGLEAFTQLLNHLPADTGMAFVLVQHLDPKHESQLTELLTPATPMPVLEAADGMAIRPDHVYVIPPNANLALARGVLRVTPRGEARGRHLPFDHFLGSLAEERQSGAIGVVLSGTGADGTRGLAEVKAVGGLTFAQDGPSAKYPGMPLSAVNSGCIDAVLPPDAIARELARVCRHPYVAVARPAEPGPSPAGTEGQFEKIIGLLRSAFGVDFTHYRETTIRRRIQRRMILHTKETLAEYAQYLGEDRTALEALYHDLLINVTSFFRDRELFEALKGCVFPEIVKTKGPETPIRVWVAGCSTGQEAYSLAIALLEFLDDRPACPPIQIFATDLSDTASLAKARAGLYPESIEAEVSPERLRRFFTKEQGGYRVGKFVRDLCVFARQNVAADPPFSRMDLISCRNVLIYLAPPLQRRVIPTFHYALNANGFLVLGAAETVGGFADLFAGVDKQHKIYARKATAVRHYPHFQVADPLGRLSASTGTGGSRPPPGGGDFQQEADRIVLGQFAPAGVLVNEGLEVVQFRGRTSPYLEPPAGEPSVNLLKMAREGLALELRSAIQEVRKHNAAVHRQGVRVRGDERVREVDLHVLPVPAAGAGYLLILFEEARPAARPVAAAPTSGLSTWLRSLLPGSVGRRPSAAAGGAGPTGDTVPPEEREASQLRRELARTRDYLQAVIEQQEAANEELQSANEEILSSNEELQSTNEEVETGKEELQSVNEELTTVNEQLQHRNVELNHLNNDLMNLLGSADVPIVMLSGDLRVRRFTTAAGEALNLVQTDVGRPLGELKLTIEVPDLEQLLLDTTRNVRVREREVRTRAGRWYALRIHPYRTADDRIDGAVLVLLDIDAVKSAEERFREASAYTQAIVETVRDPFLVLDGGLRVQTANRSFYQTFQVAPGQTESRLLFELGDRQWDDPELRRLLEEVLAQDSSFQHFDVERTFAGVGRRVMRLHARRVRGEGRAGGLILLAIEDVTERKRADEVLRAAHDELERRVAERTDDLARANEALQAEVAGHEQAEEARKALLQRLVSAQEEERRRIARELHDEMGQHLTALMLGLRALKDAAPEPSPDQERLQGLQNLTDLIGKEIHRLALELRPTALDDLGLHTTLVNYTEEWSQRAGVEVDVHSTGLDAGRLPPPVETALFRIVQEALTNVLKHAQARRVSLVVQRFEDEVRAIVEDDGRGFDAEAVMSAASGAGRLGLLGMQERVALVGGTLTLESTPDKSTTIFVRIPLPADGKEGGDDEAARRPGR